MSLFQKSVEKKYLSELDTTVLDTKYNRFLEYFGNPVIQENIRNSKEEQFQEGFLRELFVKVLDYTLNPEPQFNLTTEFKNIDDSKKADGAVLSGDDAIAIIELKSTETTDLDKVEVQAFGYKHHQPKCIYVITSNFERLRFYIENAVEYIEFDLFNLTRDQFCLMWLCLSKDSLLSNLPQKLKESSVLQEENITKKLYADYSKFREQIFGNIVKINPDFDKLILFNKTQKLLDRFLFIFFAEDRLLLPPNSISEIVKQWTTLKDELDEYIPLYDRFKKYFGYMNTGFKGKKYDIFPYNGGLFLPDEVLDNIIIDDQILYEHTLKLSSYDFETDIDVNILGHIFEHSLSDIENIQARLRGEEIDKAKTKRKKDGIFYTPKYITKYIVENTIGKLCEEKRQELGIVNEEYAKGRKNRRKDTIKALDQKLSDYREWLLSLTILDPACGSGAFLNMALDFLIKEHGKIDELRAQLLGGGIVFSDITNNILEKNIYGVDLNEESVEIAKLSLWLRTAQKGRKLNTLSNNIKCGNSLIDDPELAGQNAFNWLDEYPEIIKNGGFDIVIGNPPYGAYVTNAEKLFYKEYYSVAEYNFDTYNFFFELSLKLLKKRGYLGFITPNTFLVVENGALLRNLILKDNSIIELYETFNVFPDAVVEPIVSIIQKHEPDPSHSFNVLLQPRQSKLVENVKTLSFRLEEILSKEKLLFNYRETEKEKRLISKVYSSSVNLVEIATVKAGVILYEKGKGIPAQTAETLKIKPYHGFKKYDKDWIPLIRGTQVKRYLIEWDGEYVKYGKNLAAPRDPKCFFNPKILVRRTDDKLLCCLDEGNFVGVKSTHSVQLLSIDYSLKYILSILNSKLLNWIFRSNNFHMVGKPLAEVKVVFVDRLPIILLDAALQTPYIERVEKILIYNSTIFDKRKEFVGAVRDNFEFEKISRKLETYYENSFKVFLDELRKNNHILSLSEQADWKKYFEQNTTSIVESQHEILNIDNELDQMVYQLYGLTEEEIRIVEENSK